MDDPKYLAVRGGHALLFGADMLAPGAHTVMAEGELDTLLLWQSVQDRAATVSLGSARRWPTRRGALLVGQPPRDTSCDCVAGQFPRDAPRRGAMARRVSTSIERGKPR